MTENWIQGAIKKPGALREQLGVKEGEKIPEGKLTKIETRLRKKGEGDKKLSKSDRTTLRRVQLAKTLKGMNKG